METETNHARLGAKPMAEAQKFKTVDLSVSGFEHLKVNVCPVSVFGKPGVIGHSVGVMSDLTGTGHRTGIERAEAEAKAVLKAIRSYRRRNAALLAHSTEGES